MNKVYVDENNRATVICPKCGFEKNVDAMNFKNTTNIVKGKCKCGESFQFAIEFRKTVRRHVNLPGEYIVQGKGQKGEIIIRELSLAGIRFESLRPHQILKDDTLEVKFKLDNPLRKEICKVIKVIWVKDRMVGAQFSEKKLYGKDLGFYLKK